METGAERGYFNGDAQKRALVRLACCARVFTSDGGRVVTDAFMSLFADGAILKKIVKTWEKYG